MWNLAAVITDDILYHSSKTFVCQSCVLITCSTMTHWMFQQCSVPAYLITCSFILMLQKLPSACIPAVSFMYKVSHVPVHQMMSCQPKHTVAHFRNHLRQNCVNIITLIWLPQQQQHNVCMHLPLQTRLINLANHCSCSHMAHLLSQASNWDADKGALLAYTCELMPCHMIRKDCT